MKHMTLLSTLILITVSFLLSACDQTPESKVQKDDAFSEQGLPMSQRQQEDSAAGVKFGEQQKFPPLTPLSEESP
tara:strand:- start:238 stop:462 length:225 start_codon:yes stop_codon:yes gene_type:complete